MKTNITIDNYEAYLLDYMEGNLSPEGAAQLKTFVAAQGLDWDELTEPLPHLEAPQIVYEGKEKLKQKSLSLYESRSLSPSKGRTNHTVVPLYVKIASAAAAAGLLLTVTLWPEKSMPKVEPISELNPIEVSHINTNEPWTVLPRRATGSIDPLSRTGHRRNEVHKEATNQKNVASARETTPLLAELPTKSVTALQTDWAPTHFDHPDFNLLTYRMNADLAFTQFKEADFEAYEESHRDLSLISRGLLWLTKGRHDNFASLIGSGVHQAKQDIAEAATDMALAAYQRADESLEEAKERWEEKWGE